MRACQHGRATRSDGQTPRALTEAPVQTHVLKAVAKIARALPNDDIVHIAVPVKTKLRFPGKLARIKNRVTYERVDDVACVNIHNE